MKIFSNKTFLFRADNDKLTHVVKPGFGSAPDWVEKTELYHDAVADGSIKPFESTSDKAMEQVLKDEEKAEYERKIARLEAELAEMRNGATVEIEPEEVGSIDEIMPEVPEKKPEPTPTPKKKKR